MAADNQYKAFGFLKNIFIHSFLLIVMVSCLFPLFWMLRCSLMTNAIVLTDKSIIPATINWQNYFIAWTKGNFAIYFLNSVIYIVCVVFGIVVVSSLAVYSFSRLKFPGKDIIFNLFVAAMMIPLPGSFVPLYVLMTKLHLVNTRIGY